MSDTALSKPLARPRTANKEFIYLKPSEIAIEDDFNVRCEMNEIEELMQSILSEGVEEVFHVREENGVYVLEAGHRRFAAVQLAISRGIESPHLTQLPCRLAKSFSSEADRLLLQLVRNKQYPLSIWEQLVAVQRLRAMNVADGEIMKRWGVSHVHLKNLLKFSKAPQELITLVTNKRIAPTTAIDALSRFGEKGIVAALEEALGNAEKDGAAEILPRHFPGSCLRGTKRNTSTNERLKTICTDCSAQLKKCQNRKEKRFVKTFLEFLKGKTQFDDVMTMVRENMGPEAAPRRRRNKKPKAVTTPGA